MTNKDWKRHMAYEALVILGLLALLTFICRLWPILLLIILGIFIATLRLLFLASKKVEVIQPRLALPEPVHEPSERDVRDMAYAVRLRRITELVTEAYPDARWIWEAPNVRKLLEQGEEVSIILNRAGGYRRAIVRTSNLQVQGIEFLTTQSQNNQDSPIPAAPEDGASEEEPAENYELIAFEWVEAHIMELNERCNDAIGRGETALLLEADELPVKESWPDICEELKQADLSDVSYEPDGIVIYLTQ